MYASVINTISDNDYGKIHLGQMQFGKIKK